MESLSIYELASNLIGLKNQWSVHENGLIVSGQRLMDMVPVMKYPSTGATVTQFDYPTCEALGLIKMDFLGLKYLDLIEWALHHIASNGKLKVEIEKTQLDDNPTYELLSRGDTLGVFQLDGTAMRNLLRAMKPDNFENLTAAIALCRPGPMGMDLHTSYSMRKNGLQEIMPIHPELEKPLAGILDTTYGLIVYQEQVQRIVHILAGYSLGQADLLRRSMGKKNPGILAKEFELFHARTRARGYSNQAVKDIWDTLVTFAGYAFNKSHAISYALIAYWTAYLKANYPVEYLAALLEISRSDLAGYHIYIGECQRLGVTVVPPDINKSQGYTAAVGNVIQLGFHSIPHLSDSASRAIQFTRDRWGEFVSLSDFLARVPEFVCTHAVVGTLINAGAFGELEIPVREDLDSVIRDARAAKQRARPVTSRTQSLNITGRPAPAL